MLRVIDSLSSLYQDWSQLRAQGSVKNSSVALQEFCVCGVMRLVVARAAWRCTASMGRYVSWRIFSCCSAGSKVEGDAHLADVTQGFAIVPLLLVERIQTTHSGAQVLGGHFSQPQSCCRLHASAMSKQHPVACIPKSRKTSCSLALLICPSILLVHIGISV